MSVREIKSLRTPLDSYSDTRSLASTLKALEKQEEVRTLAEEKKKQLAEKIRAERMEELALAVEWGKKKRVPKSAWAQDKKPNRFIDGHTKVFEKYNAVQLKGDVELALKLFIEAAAKDQKRQLNEPEPEYERDKYAHIKEQLGGDEALTEMAAQWDKLADSAKK